MFNSFAFTIRLLLPAIIFTWTAHASTAQTARASQRPNIVYIYADDLGYAEIEPYGQHKIKTPHLARMAREGMRFTQHYAGSTVCAPSRCMLLTGKHSGNAYIRGNYELGGFADSLEAGQMPLPEGTRTVAHMLQDAGYRTAMIGKWGLGMHNTTGSPSRQGFDYYFGYLDQKQAHNYYPTHLWENDQSVPLDNPFVFVHAPVKAETATDADFDRFRGNTYSGDLMTARALDFIEANDEAPFFLYLAYPLPHVSLQAPEDYVEDYRGAFADTPYFGQNGYSATKYPRATYAAMITYLDVQVGRIVAHLEKLGLDDNTIVMFSSDNGTTYNGGVDPAFFRSLGDLRGFKTDLYEGGIRVPFIARWPRRIPAGTSSDHISAQYDLMATLAELLDVDAGNTDGLSFLPTLLQKGQQKKHEYLYFEYPEKGGQVAVRTGNWKGIKRDLIKNPKAAWELYDLGQDPGEKEDLAAQHPDILRQLDRIVREAHSPAHILEWEIVDRKIPLKK